MTITSNTLTARDIFFTVYAEALDNALRLEDTATSTVITDIILYAHSNIRFYSMSKEDINDLWNLLRDLSSDAVDVVINTTAAFRLRLWDNGISYNELIPMLSNAICVNTGKYNFMDEDSYDVEFTGDEWYKILSANAWLVNLALIKMYNIQPGLLVHRSKK